MIEKPKLLIEEWLPAAAIGIECMRERSTGQQPPDKRLHIWWARRPLVVSRAAVIASLLPHNFSKQKFESLLGFWGNSSEILAAQKILDWAKQNNERVQNPHGPRAFSNQIMENEISEAIKAAELLWGKEITVIDPMAGGGSIPLEAIRLGIETIAIEYNPVACSVLEATIDYPFRFGRELGEKAIYWGRELRRRFNSRVEKYFPKVGFFPPQTYLFAHTIPCPDTGYLTPLVPDWHLRKPKSGRRIVAKPIVDQQKGAWRVEIFELGTRAGELQNPPQPTYKNGKGISLFTGNHISSDYIKAKAMAGKMQSQLYAVIKRTNKGLEFHHPEAIELQAINESEIELNKISSKWEKNNIIPNEKIPDGDNTKDPLSRGFIRWSDLFSHRQLLCMGVLVEELSELREVILAKEGHNLGEAIVHLLSCIINKFSNYNSMLTSWHAPHSIMRSVFDRHDFSFKATWAEMAPCNDGSGLDWAINSVCDAYQKICDLPKNENTNPAKIFLNSAANLPWIDAQSLTAIIVDPPYAGNVQYSEIANYFYIWLKRTQGHRRPEWFSTYLSDHNEEAVVNISRLSSKERTHSQAKHAAYQFYNEIMTDTFRECFRILRDDGVLTVMFTHKKQEAWENLFNSLISAGFTITATWPVKTESEHSLHQAKKNAAQSTVILVARKREPNAGIGYFDSFMQKEIRDVARGSAERLKKEGLNPVDQLVGSFGPAMEVYSRYDEVRTDTGEPVKISEALNEASDAISAWRIEQLASCGLEGVEPEGQFTLLCWDVLGAQEFRFNEAKLLGHAVGMDVDQLIATGLVSKSSDKIRILSAQERRRERALEPDEVAETLFGTEVVSRKRSHRDVLKVHPNDPQFRTTLDACHALALRYIEAEGGSAGVGSAKALALQQNWTQNSPVARLMEALLLASPEAVRHAKGKNSAAGKFPEFRAWHAMLKPIFGLEPPDWTVKPEPFQADLFMQSESKESSE